MGGSLAAACRKKFPKTFIVGITRNRLALKLALHKRWIHQATRNLEAGVRGADVIVLCTPVDSFLPYLKKIDRVCKKCALVMDVGSVKGSVLKQVNACQWKNLSFVGCHPMVGSHERGIQAACPHLYDQGLVLLARDSKTCPCSWKQAKQFWSRFTQKIVGLTPEAHDRLVGEASHLPHAVAVCLMHSISGPALKFASTGFRDTTRVAASASSIWQPIFKANQKALLASLKKFEHRLKQFKTHLSASHPQALIRFLDQAQRKRQAL